ncbi:MAG: hypothetical protein ABIQ44_05165 [Chloroflexia bacterium]
MKLRLRSNTIRLRLLKAEVDQLALGLAVTETLPTPKPFHYRVEAAEIAEIAASFEDSTLTVRVPRDWVSTWASTDEVGRSAITDGIQILIEKDWACTTPRTSEDETGTYANPTALR